MVYTSASPTAGFTTVDLAWYFSSNSRRSFASWAASYSQAAACSSICWVSNRLACRRWPRSKDRTASKVLEYSASDWSPTQGPLQFFRWYSRHTLNFPARMFSCVRARLHVRSG